MDILSPPGVFTPISDSWWLAEAVRRELSDPGRRVLDLCTGSGVVAVAAALSGADTTAVDVSRRALLTTRFNARRNHVRVRTRRGRGFGPIRGERFDLIASNPPYVPSADDTLPRHGLERAWAAGPDGRAVLDGICREAGEHLRPGGAVLLVHSSLVGEAETLQRLRASGLVAVEVVERHRGPLGPLMLAQREAGRVPPDVDEEDVLIVRAEKPAAARS